MEALPVMFHGLSMDVGVAVWLQNKQTMSNESLQFLRVEAIKYEYVSLCYKYRLRTEVFGLLLLFPDRDLAEEFCGRVAGLRCPHTDCVFEVENLGAYIREVAEIEKELDSQLASEDDCVVVFEACAVFFRNLSSRRAVVDRVLRLCTYFGVVLKQGLIPDPSQQRLQHLAVFFGRAAEAVAAQLALDGKWINEQEQPLWADLVRSGKLRRMCLEMSKRNKLLFQS